MRSHKKPREPSTSSSSETSSDDDNSRKSRNSKHSESLKKKERLKKRKHVSSTSSESSSTSSSSDSSSSSSDEERKRSKKKKLKQNKETPKEKTTEEASSDIPLDLMTKSKAMAPMTKEEWEKRQSVVRRVYDKSTGRHRLIKGDGEVIEEVVSRERHKAINQQATREDGEFFQQTASRLKK